ncbi:MAG: VWA domain-containing protein [Ardenticatenales bacterium]|nr:VWA domain-containing protein [Ardenticatenales bacterium]
MDRRAEHEVRRPSAGVLRACAAAVTFVAVAGGLATGAPRQQGRGGIPVAVAGAACNTMNPFVAAACVDRVVLFQDTPSDQPHLEFGRKNVQDSAIGAIWGLAYSAREHAVYAAATHRRGVAFGPGGPGAVYRIDAATGDITQPIAVPDAGADHHFPGARGTDASARYWAGKTSLGDIDLDEAETELFVTNLDDRRIYRFSVPDGRLIDSFPNGGLDEAWADDARPWGLAVRAGTLYHGVIHSAENEVRRSLLRAVVYASRLDGRGMHVVYSTTLDYTRGTIQLISGPPRVEWWPWQSISLNREMNVHPMPILADIGFAADGALLLGLKDRLGDMVAPDATAFEGPGLNPPSIGNGPDVGVALGDVLYAPVQDGGWQPPDHTRFHPAARIQENWAQGGLATLPTTDTLVAGATRFDQRAGIYNIGGQVALWYPLYAHAKVPTRIELACLGPTQPQPIAARSNRVHAAPLGIPLGMPLGMPLRDDGEPGSVMFIAPAVGDVEVVCPPVVHPTATPSPTPLISPTPSSTRTPSPTRTVTPTPTDTPPPTATPTPSPTRTPAPIHLPIALSEPACVPVPPRLDILLVLDASTSMRDLTRAGRPKIDAAVAAARDFIARLNLAADGDHAALVTFNAGATLDAPLTADRATLDGALDRVALAQLTRIDLGLDAAAAELTSARRRADATAAVVLLTDGRSNPVPVSEAERAAEGVKAAGARLFTIGLGQDVDREALGRMASGPNDYFEAPDGEDLTAIYGAIARALPCAPYRNWPR